MAEGGWQMGDNCMGDKIGFLLGCSRPSPIAHRPSPIQKTYLFRRSMLFGSVA
jgi:hypothetical protein